MYVKLLHLPASLASFEYFQSSQNEVFSLLSANARAFQQIPKKINELSCDCHVIYGSWREALNGNTQLSPEVFDVVSHAGV